MSYDTAGRIINSVAAELGLAVVTDPFSSTDENIIRLVYLLNSAGEDLLRLKDFQQHRGEAHIELVGANPYALPDDFLRFIDETQQNRDTSFPVNGPLNPQDWQRLQASSLGASQIYASFRLTEGEILIWPETATDEDVYYEYIRDTWVADHADPETLKTEAEHINDIVRFDRVLIKHFLKVKWLEAKGFNSQRARADLEDMFDAITGANKGARSLHLAHRAAFPYIGSNNLPDTGYGL